MEWEEADKIKGEDKNRENMMEVATNKKVTGWLMTHLSLPLLIHPCSLGVAPQAWHTFCVCVCVCVCEWAAVLLNLLPFVSND